MGVDYDSYVFFGLSIQYEDLPKLINCIKQRAFLDSTLLNIDLILLCIEYSETPTKGKRKRQDIDLYELLDGFHLDKIYPSLCLTCTYPYFDCPAESCEYFIHYPLDRECFAISISLEQLKELEQKGFTDSKDLCSRCHWTHELRIHSVLHIH